MRFFTIAFVLFTLFSCSSSKQDIPESNIVSNFISEIESIEAIKEGNPIEQFQELAKTMSDKAIVIIKENINESLIEAESFKHAIITTGNHTIVKILSLTDCKASGSWSACMPMSKGYIKKSKLQPKEDYMNNIVGRPDQQERILFLFN